MPERSLNLLQAERADWSISSCHSTCANSALNTKPGTIKHADEANDFRARALRQGFPHASPLPRQAQFFEFLLADLARGELE